MRQNQNSRRSRGRGGRKPGSSRNQIFDSNGPGARVRGNSAQIYEKYQQLARDASSSGDRVAAENYFQHAEHYYRLMETAGLNRNGGGPDDAQQRNDGSGRNGEVVDTAQPTPDSPAQATAERVPVTIPITEPQAAQPQAPAPAESPDDEGSGNQDVKLARRSRSRRSNGAANGAGAPEANGEATAAEDAAEPLSKDTNPIGA